MIESTKTIVWILLGVIAFVAVFRFVLWTNEAPKQRSSASPPPKGGRGSELPTGTPPPLNVVSGLANTVDILSRVSDLLKEGKRDEAADFLKYAILHAREFQLTPSNYRDLEMAYAGIIAGTKGAQHMLLLQISRSIRQGDIDIVGTLLASDMFRQLTDEDRNSALSKLLRTAESANQDSIARLIQSKQR